MLSSDTYKETIKHEILADVANTSSIDEAVRVVLDKLLPLVTIIAPPEPQQHHPAFTPEILSAVFDVDAPASAYCWYQLKMVKRLLGIETSPSQGTTRDSRMMKATLLSWLSTLPHSLPPRSGTTSRTPTWYFVPPQREFQRI